jgi:uncharacterized membrane protein
VIAIAITIMVLELHSPEGRTWAALRPLVPTLLTYALSFVFLGIYWNNHHHLLHTAERVNGTILWANMHLLFWLSLMPFTTAWAGATRFAPIPTAVYGVVLLAAALAYLGLQTAIVAHHGPNSRLAEALGDDLKGKISAASYAVAIPLAFVERWVSVGLYVLVALLWLVPDRRIESRLDR